MRKSAVCGYAPEISRLLPSEDHWLFSCSAHALGARRDHFTEKVLTNVALSLCHCLGPSPELEARPYAAPRVSLWMERGELDLEWFLVGRA